MTDDDRTSKPPERRRPTAWIVATAVLAVVAIGLGIWAFSAQSDADDAQAKVDAQEQAASTVDVDADVQQRYEEVKAQLGITGENLDQFNAELEDALANAEQAAQARTDAEGAIDRASAELEAFKAQVAVTQTCLRGTLDALGAAFSSGGVEAAVTELESLSSGCESVAAP